MTPAVNRDCPVCDSSLTVPYLQKGELRLVQCSRCSMIYANPVPAEFASGEYYDHAGAEYYLSPAKLESDYAGVRFERELRFFRKHCPAGQVLDVGCSSGAFLYQLRRRFPGSYEVLGTDVSGAPLDYAEARGIPVARGNFLEQDFGGRTFDAITMWAVIEHLAAPKRFIERAAALLKPNGVCFVLVPNMQSLAVRLLGARYRYIYGQHLNYFTKVTLLQLVASWFVPCEIRSTHYNPIVIWQDWRQRGREVSNQERGELLKRTTSYKQNPLLKPVKALYRLTEGVLGSLTLADNLAVVCRKTS
jgi:2-polyprenyl-3-methyl-5-hydroxy-6-metoxy-1,4-benzoquinol methylase